MKNKISRKTFLRNFGWTALGASGLPALLGSGEFPVVNSIERPPFVSGVFPEEDTIRGSWVRQGAPLQGDVVLAENKNGCRIVLDEKAHPAMRQAATFLAADIEKLSGYLPPITPEAAPGGANIFLVQQGDRHVHTPMDISMLKGQWEAHVIATAAGNVWLVGSDFRGAAFAAYKLAERLGIDPLHWWTGYRARRHESLVMKETFCETPAPVFKYRGFFHDDEDILPRPFEMSGYPLRTGDVSLVWYQRFFETALRLGMNMVAPYTRVHRRQEVQQCASDWGLFYTSHHYDILLSNPFGIERYNLAENRGIDPTWDWFKNKAGMQGYWRGGVEENKDLYTIWPVGLRGTDDHAYHFPPNMPPQQQVSTFNEVIDWQIETVKKLLPTPKEPIFHFTLYTEMLEKYQNNPQSFNIPEDVIIVWPDDNDGVMRALPKETGKWKHGVYYHLAYFGGEKSKQATHVVSPYTIASELNKIIEAKATEFLLVNVSEVRSYVMEARMIAEMSWNGIPSAQPDREAEAYIRWWIKEYFGAHLTEEALTVYQQYYKIFDTPDKVWGASEELQGLLELLVDKFKGQAAPRFDPSRIARLKHRDMAYRSTMEVAVNVSGKANGQASRFFFENAMLGLFFDWYPTQAALLLAEALKEEDLGDAWGFVTRAMVPLEQLEIAIQKAERPPFERWYRESWIRKRFSRYNVHRSFELLRGFIAADGKALPEMPESMGHAIAQAKEWTRFLEASEKVNHPMSAEWL